MGKRQLARGNLRHGQIPMYIGADATRKGMLAPSDRPSKQVTASGLVTNDYLLELVREAGSVNGAVPTHVGMRERSVHE